MKDENKLYSGRRSLRVGTVPLPAWLSKGTIGIACALLLVSCAESDGPDVVIVTLDTIQVWETSLYSDIDTTPSLASLAADGVLFEQVRTPAPMTLPAHTTLFTGLMPQAAGVLANGDVVPEELTTLAELLRAHGYQTAAFPSLGVLGRQFGLDQGFAVYEEPFSSGFPRWYRFADEVIDDVEVWLRGRGDEPVFAWVHLSDPHEPYATSDAEPDTELLLNGVPLGRWALRLKERRRVNLELQPGRNELEWRSIRQSWRDDKAGTELRVKLVTLGQWRGLVAEELPDDGWLVVEPSRSLSLLNDTGEVRQVEVIFNGELRSPGPSEARSGYREELRVMDQQLERLRKLFSDRGRPTLWVVVSDHGEGLYEHGILGHQDYTREEQLRALWLMVGPGVPKGVRLVEPSAFLVDVFPTVVDLLAVPGAPTSQGTSLTGCWSESDSCPDNDREWVAYGLDVERQLSSLSVFAGSWKLYEDRQTHGVYELVSDPREQTTLQDRQEEIEEELRKRWEDERRSLERALARGPGPELTKEEREMLESLGYL